LIDPGGMYFHMLAIVASATLMRAARFCRAKVTGHPWSTRTVGLSPADL
jgi:hypothetical protein